MREREGGRNEGREAGREGEKEEGRDGEGQACDRVTVVSWWSSWRSHDHSRSRSGAGAQLGRHEPHGSAGELSAWGNAGRPIASTTDDAR